MHPCPLRCRMRRSRNEATTAAEEEDTFAVEDESEALYALGLPSGFGSSVSGCC